jgi:transcriptional regulator with XRE-family HTH domain
VTGAGERRGSKADTRPLESYRLAKPWTQGELARAANVSIMTIRSIENGHVGGRLRARTMRALAAALGVQPGDIAEFESSLRLNGGGTPGHDPKQDGG